MSEKSTLQGREGQATNIESTGSDLSESKVETPGNPPDELQALDWDGPDDPGNPQNVRATLTWSFALRKCGANRWSLVVKSQKSPPHLCIEHAGNGRVRLAALLWYLLCAYANICDQQDCRRLIV